MQKSIMNAIKKFLVTVPAFLLVPAVGFPISVALAAVPSTTISSPVTSVSDIQNLLCAIIAWFIWIVIIVSVIMVVYAAYTYATAGDDTEKVATGRKTITYAAVGIAVALMAAGIPAIVESLFGSSLGFSVSCLVGS